MGLAAKQITLSEADYLDWEAQQSQRHEYVAGEVYAMAGAEDRHNTVCLNLAFALRRSLAGTTCRTYMSDVKVQVAASQSFFYPDLLVTCSGADLQDRRVKREPRLIVEVLSPSTASFDRGEKFAHYRRIAALQEYALIDLDTRRCDVYRKGADGLWVLHPVEAGEDVELASTGSRITALELFDGVEGIDAPFTEGVTDPRAHGSPRAS